MIKNIGGMYTLFSKDGSKTLGSYKTMDEAEKRERQVKGFASHGTGSGASNPWGKLAAGFDTNRGSDSNGFK